MQARLAPATPAHAEDEEQQQREDAAEDAADERHLRLALPRGAAAARAACRAQARRVVAPVGRQLHDVVRQRRRERQVRARQLGHVQQHGGAGSDVDGRPVPHVGRCGQLLEDEGAVEAC
jgi:hypothetical protein